MPFTSEEIIRREQRATRDFERLLESLVDNRQPPSAISRVELVEILTIVMDCVDAKIDVTR